MCWRAKEAAISRQPAAASGFFKGYQKYFWALHRRTAVAKMDRSMCPNGRPRGIPR